MPNYDYMCKECDHVWEEQQTVASRNVHRYNPCPNCGTSEDIVLVVGSPRIGDPVQLGIRRPEKGFLENLKRIEKQYSKPAGTTLGNRYI